MSKEYQDLKTRLGHAQIETKEFSLDYEEYVTMYEIIFSKQNQDQFDT